MKAYVSITDEAFGWLFYENYHDAWLAKFKYVKKNSSGKYRAKKPVYSSKKHEETKDYKAKWSDCKTGQGSSWDKAAYPVLKANKELVKAFRDQDQENGGQIVDKCMDILAIVWGIDPNQPEEPASKKQKVGKLKVVEEEEEEDDDEDFDD